jgi:hypothetical protein
MVSTVTGDLSLVAKELLTLAQDQRYPPVL